MKKLYLSLITALLGSTPLYAGLITHTDYTAGNVITAAGQNTNENTVFNEFNGNIESANIKDGTIVNVDLSASANIDISKINSTLTSTLTYINTLGSYRRPNLQFIDSNTVDIEANTGTSNQTCVQFPNEQRCVTENTGSTSVNRRFIITEAASNTGTKNSGLIGATRAINTWYALYAWKVSDNSTDFVVVGTTVQPVQAQYATLNSMFGTGSWLYLATIRNGEQFGSSTNIILNFRQSGPMMRLIDVISNTGSAGITGFQGILMADTASGTTLTFGPSVGTSSNTLPSQFLEVRYQIGRASPGSAKQFTVFDNDGVQNYWESNTDASRLSFTLWALNDGVQLNSATTAVGLSISVIGWYDPILANGYNPQL